MRAKEYAGLIGAAIKTAREKGWNIMPMITKSDEHNCCCPMGAVIIASNSPGYMLHDAADILGITYEQARAFATGFDGAGGPAINPLACAQDGLSADWVLLGRNLRLKLLEGRL